MARKLRSIVPVLLLFFVPTLFARDFPSQEKIKSVPFSHTHSGSSPFSPSDEEDTLFAVDSGSGLDTGCTFRGGGPLRI